MEFFEALETRRSIRSFLPDPISEADIAKMIKAGSLAPSAMNKQPWHFVVVTDRAVLDELSVRHPHCRFADEAPLAIVVAGEPDSVTGDFWIQDCSAATENILLAARALGIASVWCGVHPVKDRVDAVSAVLKLPPHIIPLSLIVLGRTSKEFTTAHRGNPFKVHRNSW
ncbi:MAG: nitroreductase family protein [Desulfovibrionaceae bacterium]|nr:nitroreductase family protein [Desulfovibrionaceae bacterium]